MRHVRMCIVAAIAGPLFLSGCVHLRSEKVIVVAPSLRYTDQTAEARSVGPAVRVGRPRATGRGAGS